MTLRQLRTIVVFLNICNVMALSFVAVLFPLFWIVVVVQALLVGVNYYLMINTPKEKNT